MNINSLIFPYDYIIVVIFVIIILFCFLRGFIQSMLGLLTWVGSILITIYTYETLSNYIVKQILKINFFQKFEYLSNIGSLVISIPIIFLISLFILKRIRKLLSSDLDKEILGIIFDKFFGFIYGLIFSYIILTSALIILNKFEFDSLKNWTIYNSNIVSKIDNFNKNYIYLLDKVEEVN